MDGINAYALSTNSTRKLAFHCKLFNILTSNHYFFAEHLLSTVLTPVLLSKFPVSLSGPEAFH